MPTRTSEVREHLDGDELSVPTRTLLFAPLGSTDMPSAVVHRLRAAIGLGLLADGKRLPKEADLASQLGVTTFAMREAVKMLGTYASRVGEARTSLEARRAHGRFHLELASAAQSMRMTRAEFAVHEQIDWLFGLALQTAEERAASATELKDIAAAVKARNPQRARTAAARHMSHLIDRLAQLRLEGLAAQQHADTGVAASTLEFELGGMIDLLVSELSVFAEDVAPAMAVGQTFQQVRNRVSLAGLQRFAAFPQFVKGVGIVAEIGVVPEHPYWIEWWRRTEFGPVADNHHVLDPAREDFYDYQSMEFMKRPRQSHEPSAYGPYVDYGGIDDYILTVASPIMTSGAFCGVSCVDILVADLESWLSPLLAAAEESYLLNYEDRVIISNSLTYSVGDVMNARWGCQVVEFPVLGWSLLTNVDTSD